MTPVLPATLLGIITVLALGVERTGPETAGAMAQAISYPTGSVVLHQSISTMQRSLHAVHTAGRVQLRWSHQTAHFRVTGDCVTRPRYQAVRFWNRGNGFVNGVRHAVNAHYITIQGHTWRRSPSNHNTWRRADSDQGALLGVNLCPAFFTSLPGIAALVPSARNLGAVTHGTREAWHIRIRASSFVIDVYVDQRSHDWLRLSSDVAGPPWQHAVFDYWRFNESISITPPRIVLWNS